MQVMRKKRKKVILHHDGNLKKAESDENTVNKKDRI